MCWGWVIGLGEKSDEKWRIVLFCDNWLYGVFKCLGDLCESVLFSVGEYVCNSVVVDVKFVIDLIFM